MREIKFRAWDKRRCRMRHGIDNLMLDLGGHFYWQFGHDEPEMLDDKEAADFVLQQFTGLKDRNGREIYEGDVLRGKCGNAYIVTWNTGGFEARFGQQIVIDPYRWNEREVIGNIYENPELTIKEGR